MAPAPRDPHRDLPARVDFKPRAGLRPLVLAITLVVTLAGGIAGWQAWQMRTSANIGMAAVLGALALVLWGLLSSTSTARVSIDRGRLDVRTDRARHSLDLTNQHNIVEIIGSPGRLGWQVRFLQAGRAVVVVDRSMVDPRHFTEVLARYRPELAPPPPPPATRRYGRRD